MSSTMDFSSPYHVKVVKEVAKQRREEVDLDTGRRRSWVETTEVEELADRPKPGTMHEEGEGSRGSFRSPLKDQSRNLVTNLTKELTMEMSPHSLMPPPASSSRRPSRKGHGNVLLASFHRIFKSLRGVRSDK